MRSMELLLLIKDSSDYLYYDKFDNVFTYEHYNKKHLEEQTKKYGKKNLSLSQLTPNIKLPSYEEIDHEQIMRYYVREFIDDKAIRKTLFSILSRINYVEPFIEKLKELNLYEDYYDACGNVYKGIMEEWAEKNSITF